MHTNDFDDLANSKNHFTDCHNRWVEKRNRNIDSPDYKEEWYLQQCFNCKYFIPLTGIFIDDYGACTNEKSNFDKHVMFEHDGCKFHVLGENL